jgi:hypothetical protein
MNQRTCRNLPLAVLLVAGIIAFAWGASRIMTGSVNQLAQAIEQSKRSSQIVGAE